MNSRAELIVANLLLVTAVTSPGAVWAEEEDELNNTITYSSAFFTDEPQTGADRPQISALSIESEVFLDLTDRLSFTALPYLKYEHLSEDNLHLDLRELYFRYSADNWDLRAGITREFWGVTESRNLVDTLNQSDFVADFAGDEKLGQPMVAVNWFSDYGTFGFYYLPEFREREFASVDSRPRSLFVQDESLTTYESADGKNKPEFALRWSGNLGIWDLGVHYFDGTKRQPLLTIPDPTQPVAATRYQTVQQIGIDAQATSGALLSKLEVLWQTGDEIDTHVETVGGIEYTFSQLAGTEIEIGLLTEFLYDSRQEDSDHQFQNDALAGFRVVFNDENSTELLASTIIDLDNSAKFFQVEFDRRIGRNFTVGLTGNWWRDTEEDANLRAFKTEDHILFNVFWYF